MTEPVKLDPPIGFDLEGWPAILTAMGKKLLSSILTART